MKPVLKFLDKNALVVLYSVMFFTLFYGVIIVSGVKYLLDLLIYFGVFITAYIFLRRVQENKASITALLVKFRSLKIPLIHSKADIVLSIIILVIIAIHIIDMGYIPIIKAYKSLDYYEVVGIRKEISLVSLTWVRYLSFFAVKAMIPFTLLLLFVKKRWILYFVMLFITSFYALSLMQKSYILTILFPLIIYTLINRKWFFSMKYIGIIVSGIYILLYVSNPQLREIEIPEEVIEEQRLLDAELRKEVETEGKIESVSTSERNAHFLRAIYNRVFIVPGEMVADWFMHVPKDEPFLRGQGYRFIAPFIGKEYVNYSQKLYHHIYPVYAKRGIQGNANAASFMYDYSNFGILGLVLSGIILSIVFVIVDTLFQGNLVYKISLNSLYVLMLSSSALSTLLLSGGWGLMILLFLLVKPSN